LPRVTQIVLLHEGDDGHRHEYLQLFQTIIADAGGGIEHHRLKLADIASKSTLFSLMLEDHTLGFCLVALLRSLLGRRSFALSLLVSSAVHRRTLRHRVKRLLLTLIKRSRHANVLSILPTGLDRRLETLVDGWIYDPQLWDEPDAALPSPTPRVIERAAGRQVVCALGLLTLEKGFDRFCRMWLSHPGLRQRYLFVAAGRLEPGLSGLADRFVAAGGMLDNRLIGDEELRAYYGASDLVWSCYAPDYDQSSRIFGRAAQFGRRPIVREGSYLDGLATALDVPALRLTWDVDAAAKALIDSATVVAAPIDRQALRDASLETLSHFLKLDLGAHNRRA
jgi:hypothetical protein